MIGLLADPRPTLDRARARLSALGPGRGAPVDLNTIEEVVILASSSRGGSSVTSELLRAAPTLNHLRAELNPFIQLAGAGAFESGQGDDSLPANIGYDAGLWARELGLEVGRRAGAVDLDAWAWAWAQRLVLQWPDLDIPPDAAREAWGAAVAAALPGGLAPGPLAESVLTEVNLGLLLRLRQRWPGLDPWAYDLPAEAIRAACPGLGPALGPPGVDLLEEPPFVAVRPWSLGVVPGPLIIKTPSNSYRLDWLRRRFPAARFKVLHLVRNPAAAINGLVDGWRFRGFHSHRLRAPLQIAGYTDHRPQDAHHWKYDLFPGWAAHRGAALVDVAAAQWMAAHSATLDWLDAHPDTPRLQLRFEDLMGAPEVRSGAIGALEAFLGLPPGGPLAEAAAAPLPTVMATASPRARRWFDRAEALEAPLRRPELRALAQRLGVGDPEAWS